MEVQLREGVNKKMRYLIFFNVTLPDHLFVTSVTNLQPYTNN
jgi:hypothetical protein